MGISVGVVVFRTAHVVVEIVFSAPDNRSKCCEDIFFAGFLTILEKEVGFGFCKGIDNSHKVDDSPAVLV